MTSIAIATTNQYIFRRNYLEKRWVNVDASDKACKVQVLKRNNEFTFKVFLEGGQQIEHKLARDNQLHISNGFIQVPVSGHGNEMELYGIKFKNDTDAQVFYAKIVNEIGQPWMSQKTSVGDDQLPQPVGQSLQPLNVVGSSAHSSQPFQTLPPTTSQAGVHLPPSMQHQQQQQQLASNIQSPRNQPGQYIQQPGQFIQQQGLLNQQGGQPGQFNQQGVQFNQQGSQPGQFNQQGSQPGQFNQQGAQFNQQGGQFNQLGNQPGPGQFNQQGRQFNQQGGQPGQYNQPDYPYQQQPQRSIYPEQTVRLNGGQGMNPQGNQGMNPQGNQGLNLQGNQGMNPQVMNVQRVPANPNMSRVGGAQKKKPPPQNYRKQTVPKPSEMSNVTDSLMNALNHGETENAKHLFDVLLLSVTNPDQGKSGQFNVSFDKSARAPPKAEKSFVLAVHMEFQSPRRDPMDIFLDVTADKTIMDLQYEVERRFYVPRASQNWIIGPKLVKNADDLGKTLKDFNVTGVGVSGVDVCMYVMHTKKANVPKEEFEALRNRQQQTQKMQQNAALEEQRVMRNQVQTQVSQPPGNVQQYSQQQQQQQQMNEPLYDKLRNRGYAPDQQQQQPIDPTYSHLDVYQQGGGQPEPMVRASNPPPPHAAMPQGNTDPRVRASDPGMYQAEGGGAGGGIVQQQMPTNAFPNQQQAGLQHQLSAGIPNGAHHPQPQQQAQQPPPPLPPKAEERKIGWSCPRCTFINRPRRPGCEQCSADRPDDYVIPDDCPVEEFEREAMENEKLFGEYETKEKERREQEALENYQKLVEAEEAQLTTNKEEFECMICYGDVEPGEGVILKGCVHQFCKDCLHDTVINSEEAEVKCPFDDGEYTCGAVISEREIRAVCTEEEVKAVHRRGLAQAENAAQNSFHCQTPNCEGFCFYEDDVNEFRCPVCFKINCLLCKAIHEGMNCQEYQDDIKRRAANDEAAQATQKMLEDLVRNGEAMNCPACKIIVQKKDGCDWIRCSMCKTEICWATKGPRWGPNGKGDTSGGCKCRVGGKKCTPLCRNCH